MYVPGRRQECYVAFAIVKTTNFILELYSERINIVQCLCLVFVLT